MVVDARHLKTYEIGTFYPSLHYLMDFIWSTLMGTINFAYLYMGELKVVKITIKRECCYSLLYWLEWLNTN